MDEDVKEVIKELKRRMKALEDEMLDLAGLPGAVERLEGVVDTLKEVVLKRLDGVHEGVEKAASLRSAITFASVVIVPILVALIGGYFVLKTGSGK